MIEHQTSPSTSGTDSICFVFSTEPPVFRTPTLQGPRVRSVVAGLEFPTDAIVINDTSDWLGVSDATSSAADSLDNIIQQNRIQHVGSTLLQLSHQFFEDFGRPMSQPAIQAALQFFQRHQGIRVPDFSAEPSGFVLATWRSGRQVLTMRFKDEQQIHYTAATQQGNDDHLKRSWGVVSLDGIAGLDATFLLT